MPYSRQPVLGHLVGGFDLAAQWAGWENIFHCEWNPFGQKVLNHYWPNAESFTDITKTDFTKYANTIDILTGGFPCQPYSVAGKRKGKEDDRHLWPEMLRAIREIKPRYIVGENVSGLVSWDRGLVFEEVQTDLEAEGYKVQAVLLPACAVDAPHRRDRVWFVAYSDNPRTNEQSGINRNRQKENKGWKEQLQPEFGEDSSDVYGNDTNTNGTRLQKKRTEQQATRIEQYRELEGITTDTDNEILQGSKIIRGIAANRKKPYKQPSGCVPSNWQNFPTQPPICDGNDGLSSRLDGITFPKWRNESIKAGGNAIVPQLAFEIFKVINQLEQ